MLSECFSNVLRFNGFINDLFYNQDYAKVLSQRAVAYLNIDTAVEGKLTFLCILNRIKSFLSPRAQKKAKHSKNASHSC